MITTKVYVGRFPTDFAPIMMLMRAHLKMSRETADDVVRARGYIFKRERARYYLEDSYLDDDRHGFMRGWRRGGLRFEIIHVNGTERGIRRFWRSNGMLSAAILFMNNHAHGVSRGWRRDGSLRYEIVHDHGQVVSQHNF